MDGKPSPGYQGGDLEAPEGRASEGEVEGWGDQGRALLNRFPQLQEKADLGELNFSLCYLPTAGRLTVTIIKASNLKAMDLTGFSGGFQEALGSEGEASGALDS